jgi:hypothetical protein
LRKHFVVERKDQAGGTNADFCHEKHEVTKIAA